MLRVGEYIFQFIALELVLGNHFIDELGNTGKFGGLNGKRAQQQQG